MIGQTISPDKIAAKLREGGRGMNARPRGAFDIMMSVLYHHDVRTTLTVDDDVAAHLQELARQSRQPFKRVVNDMLRLGLQSRRTLAPRRRFVVKARDTALKPGVELDCAAALIERIEGSMHR